MKKILLGALLVSGLAFGQTKNVTSSTLNWWGYKVAKTEGSQHTGTINLKSGNIVLKGKNIVGGTFVLDVNSLVSTDLSGEDQQRLHKSLLEGFFEGQKYPTATYKITSVKPLAANKVQVNGNLTAKNKTHQVSFPATISMDKGVVKLVSDKFSFDRQKFDIKHSSTMRDMIVKDDIDMKVELTAK